MSKMYDGVEKISTPTLGRIRVKFLILIINHLLGSLDQLMITID